MPKTSSFSKASSGAVPSTMSPPPGFPVLVPLPKGQATFGTSRSEIYRAGAEEPGLLVKIGSRTYIVSAVMLARIEKLQKLVPKRDPRRGSV